MAETNEAPSYDEQFKRIKGRVTAIEKALRRPAPNIPMPEKVFSHPNTVTIRESPPWTPRERAEVVELVSMVNTAGTEELEIELRKNGLAVASLRMPAGQNRTWTVVEGVFFAPNFDLMTIAITADGGGAEDWGGIVRMRRP